MAACPCCRSRRGRPLAVTDPGDGRVLLHAFCGCDTGAVLGALGLAIGDLFDRPLAHHTGAPTRARVPARDLLAIIDQETQFVALLACDILERRQVREEDWSRLARAAGRIEAARSHVD